ncbi:hypothetical protein D3C75_1386990 [compost metagenome]
MPELICLLYQLSFGRIKQMTDELGMVRHNSEEKDILINNRIRQWFQSSAVKLF